MSFYNHFEKIIRQKLEERDTTGKIIAKIEQASEHGKIAFYPFGRPSRLIINEIKKTKPELLGRILGGFDKSKEVSPEDGVVSHQITELNNFKDQISLLVVASNTFYKNQLQDIKELTNYDGEILKTSFFELSLPENYSVEEVMLKIKKTYDLFSDKKSKNVYMIAWLSRMLNDEGLTHLFETEEKIDVEPEPINYGDFKIHGIDKVCKKELISELYKIKHVAPHPGDVVFDIGAYKGDTAIFFAHHVQSHGKVFAFEPIKPNFEFLSKNIEANDLGNVVIPVNKGISNKNGVLKGISITTGAPWSYLSEDKEGDEVEVTTVDSFTSSNNLEKVDFIKMDVEGLEEDVLNGAENTIRNIRPKLAIAIYHFTTDLFLLPLMIANLADYKFYIRSKLEGPFGFTLYCAKNE